MPRLFIGKRWLWLPFYHAETAAPMRAREVRRDRCLFFKAALAAVPQPLKFWSRKSACKPTIASRDRIRLGMLVGRSDLFLKSNNRTQVEYGRSADFDL